MQNTNSVLTDKKGSGIIDIIFIIIVVFIIGLGFFFVKFVFSDINDGIQLDDDLPAQSKAYVSDGYNNFGNWADYSFAFVFFGLIIGILITSFLIDTHPIFFIISVIAFVFVIFIGANIANTFEEVVGEAELSVHQADFPMIMFIMTHLVEILIVSFALVLIVLYSRGGGGNQR